MADAAAAEQGWEAWDDARMPDVSVVMPCLNAAGTLAAQLDALARQRTTARWELIVSNNGSTDGSQALVQRWRDRLPHLRLVDSSSRRRVGAARGAGARAARGELTLTCDADDIVGEHWIEAMTRAAQGWDLVGEPSTRRHCIHRWCDSGGARSRRAGS